MRCLNCNEEVTGKFCSNCGQSTRIQRFDGRYFVYSIIHSFDLSRGFFHTLWFLLIKPGTAIREYLQGHRVGFDNPIKLFLILGAIATFVTFNYPVFTAEDLDYPSWLKVPEWTEYVAHSAKYFSFTNLSAIPLFALFGWLIFIKREMNFMEHLIFNVYIFVGQCMILLVFAPIIVNYGQDSWVELYAIFNFVYNLWALVFFVRAFNVRGIITALLAIAIPAFLAYYFNYLLFILIPESFWELVEAILT